MITIRKLLALPKKTRLRKIVRVLEQLERRSVEDPSKPLSDADRGYVRALLGLLTEESQLDAKTHGLASETRDWFARDEAADPENRRRYLNAVRHSMLQALGEEPSDWDLTVGGSDELDRSRRTVRDLFVYLEDLRAPFNVGSILRTAEAFGIRHVYLSSECPKPDHPRARRSAMGAESALDWSIAELPEAVEHAADLCGLSREEMPVIAVETGGTELRAFRFPALGMIVLGSEELGVSSHALRVAEASAGRITIPLAGAKSSLNVGVAFGIVAATWVSSLSA